jgi:thiosulfate dehydrogenase
MRKFVLGLLLGLLLPFAGAYLYLHSSRVPVAVADSSFPMEAAIVRHPLDARIDREAPKSAPMEASPANLQLGAQVYHQQCAQCHGYYGQSSPIAKAVFPRIPQLWAPHGHGVVGVSDDPVGETYWKVANGIRLSAMPSYKGILSEPQMWQVALLLANADKPLPAGVLDTVKPAGGAPAQ